MSGQSVRGSWDHTLALHLVRHAARKAPPGLTERLEEEWQADLLGRKGAFSRIRFGLGCCWATRVIAREFDVAAVTVASSGPGHSVLIAHGGHDFSWLSRRTLASVAIVFLHAAVLYAYLSSHARKVVDQQPPLIDGSVLTQHRLPPTAKPLLPPTFATTTVETLAPPDFPLNFPADPGTIAVTHDPLPSVATTPQVARRVLRVSGGPGAGFPNTEDFYPPAARRLGEAGAAAVQVCVDSNGRLTANPAIVQSSGIARLDAGALRLAQAGSGHYRPTMEDGRPVSSCYAFRVRFRLEDE